MTEKQMQEAIDAANRRADDYIHEARMTLEAGLRSYQAELSVRLLPCFLDVLGRTNEDFSEDQQFFAVRMNEIIDTLMDNGIIFNNPI